MYCCVDETVHKRLVLVKAANSFMFLEYCAWKDLNWDPLLMGPSSLLPANPKKLIFKTHNLLSSWEPVLGHLDDPD